MSLTLPPGDILETPPGYPFEEINYEDIEVEEVGRVNRVFIYVVYLVLFIKILSMLKRRNTVL